MLLKLHIIALCLSFLVSGSFADTGLKPNDRIRLKVTGIEMTGYKYQGNFWLIGNIARIDSSSLILTYENEAVRIPYNQIKELELSIGGKPYDQENAENFKMGFIAGCIIGVPLGVLIADFSMINLDGKRDYTSTERFKRRIFGAAVVSLFAGFSIGAFWQSITSLGVQEYWKPLRLPIKMSFNSSYKSLGIVYTFE